MADTKKEAKKTENDLNPSVDLRENSKEFLAILELPGLSRKDVKIALNIDTLTIIGKKRKPKTIKKENENISECDYGIFKRELTLPNTVNPKKVKAIVKNGRMIIEMPKKDYKKKMKISVK